MDKTMQAGNGRHRNRAELNLPASRPFIIYTILKCDLRGIFKKIFKKIKAGVESSAFIVPICFLLCPFLR